MEPTYENFPSAMQKKRQNRNVGGVSLGGATKFNGTDGLDDPDHIYQNPSRIRGSSVDRHSKFSYKNKANIVMKIQISSVSLMIHYNTI